MGIVFWCAVFCTSWIFIISGKVRWFTFSIFIRVSTFVRSCFFLTSTFILFRLIIILRSACCTFGIMVISLFIFFISWFERDLCLRRGVVVGTGIFYSFWKGFR